MSLANLTIITGLAAVAWYFFDAMRTREMATAMARSYCKHANIQFLDGTVSLSTVRIVRYQGRLNFRRCYEFHYSDMDNSRSIGTIIIIGKDIVNFAVNSESLIVSNSVLEA